MAVVAGNVSAPVALVLFKKLDGDVGVELSPIPIAVITAVPQLAGVRLGLSGAVPAPDVEVDVTSSGVVRSTWL